MKKISYILILLTGLVYLSSCNKLLEVKPKGLVGVEEGITTADQLDSVLIGTYDIFRNGAVMGGTPKVAADVLADEVYASSTGFEWGQIKTLNMNLFNPIGRDIWQQSYITINRTNVVIDYIDNNKVVLTDAQKKQWKAEARFIRAVCSFHLAQYFALPYDATTLSKPGIVIRTQAVLTNEFAATRIQRSTVEETYKFIIDELTAAETDLASSSSTAGRVKKDAASAYLAKVYFQMNNMTKAYEYADKIVGNEGYSLDAWWGDKFAHASLGNTTHEVIFALTSTAISDNSASGLTGSYRTDQNAPPGFGPTDKLVANLQAIPVDTRAAQVVTKAGQANVVGVYSTKYNYTYMNAPVICYNEILLIHAESGLASGQGDPTQDLNAIQVRSGVPTTAASAASILAERRKELALEGVYFFDLKRTKSNNIKGVSWNSSKLIFQIPDIEQNGNPSIILN
ncbi:MAG: RagB/SusD family nutrient uptake outer membrane protein [Bacteroidota bacterium]